MARQRWYVDPADPRAPPAEVWQELSEEERARICAALPSEFAAPPPPEGDFHRVPKVRAFDALEEFYRRTGRRVYLGSELPIYYPNERMFAPDIIAVFDVEPHERNRWVVSQEGKGIDFALEILSAADPKKDLVDNVVRFARLGIPEYFVFDVRTSRLIGYRLDPAGTPGTYAGIVPQQGRWTSTVLGLDLALEGRRVRFYHGSALLFEPAELIVRLEKMLDELVARRDEAEQAKEQAEQAKEQAEQAKERLAQRLRELGVDPDDV